ncbi:acetyl-CoA carboxylase biotin carboxyl carrier protein subunit domain protein, partial [Neisseria lactamica ATCC 23970]
MIFYWTFTDNFGKINRFLKPFSGITGGGFPTLFRPVCAVATSRLFSEKPTQQPAGKPAAFKGTKMDLRKLKKLIDLVEESGIAEIEVTEGEEKVRITRTIAAAPVYAAPVPAAAPAVT